MITSEPLFFGRDGELFGLFHPANNGQKSHAIVIMPPLLNEGMRAHYALRQLALRLSGLGYDVLRFDPSGHGNSLKPLIECTPATWHADLTDAITELEEISGANQVSVVAARFSCAFASKIARDSKVTTLACWDPVFRGSQWAASLERSKRTQIQDTSLPDLVGESEYLGHQLNNGFLASITELDPQPPPEMAVKAVYSSELNRLAAGIEGTVAPFECNWEDLTSQVLYAHEVVNTICEWFP